jgi:transcription antitermination factor NusG
MPIERLRWYVVRTVHGQTDLAEQEIREAGFETVTARLCRPATKARRSVSGSLVRAREEHFVPLFVRYVVVRLNLADPSWHAIPEMDSVERIISGGHHTNGGIGIPISVPDSAIERLRKILSPCKGSPPGGPDGVYYPPGYRARTDDADAIEAGAALRMEDGPFADRAAVCEASDGQRIVMVMNLFNRDNVRVSRAQAGVEAFVED